LELFGILMVAAQLAVKRVLPTAITFLAISGIRWIAPHSRTRLLIINRSR